MSLFHRLACQCRPSLSRQSSKTRISIPKRLFSCTFPSLLQTEVEYKPCGSSAQKVAHLSFYGDKRYPIATRDSMQTLLEELSAIENQTDVTSLILRSTFVGADLDVLKCLQGPRDAKDFIKFVDTLCSKLQDFRVPVISIIDGPCMGAGMEVAAACDLRYATSNALFAMPETKLVSLHLSDLTPSRGLKWHRESHLWCRQASYLV